MMLQRSALILCGLLLTGCQSDPPAPQQHAPALEPALEPALKPATNTKPSTRDKKQPLRLAPSTAFDQPMPVGLLLKHHAPHSQTFETEASLDELLTFAKTHLPEHSIKIFRTGSVRLTPPDDGTEVLIIPLSSGRRRVSYRRLSMPIDAGIEPKTSTERATNEADDVSGSTPGANPPPSGPPASSLGYDPSNY